MCGVAGIVDLSGAREPDRAALKRMTDALRHRGPDGEGFYIADGVGFGHRRLAIIDRAGGAQPFLTRDGAGALTFNGEIYNHRELMSALALRGLSPRTRSDAEALAEGLNVHGQAFIHQLRGMFAFAFWNARDRTLLLVRDRLGEKPLYYAQTADGYLAFASEIGALAASGLVPLEIDLDALNDYFLYGFIPDPKSIYRSIRKLPAAHLLSAKRGGDVRVERYWEAPFAPDGSLDFSQAVEAMRAHLADAVAAQMVSDVPLGAFLSGGVDSSAIVAAMAHASPRPATRLKTCSVGFPDPSADERPFARQVAALFGADHHEEVAAIDVAALIDDVARAFGEPFADSSALPSYVVSRLARQHVAVALSGDGADEVFAGYRRYPAHLLEQRVRTMAPRIVRAPLFSAAAALYPKLDWAPRPLRLKTTLHALSKSAAEGYANAMAANLPGRIARLLSKDFRASARDFNPYAAITQAMHGDDPLAAAQQADFATWLPGRMLVKVDRTSMAHSLEVRAPFLDHKLVEWAGSLPSEYKLYKGAGKRILKESLVGRLPDSILNRSKRGFAPPLASWLQDKDGPLDRLFLSRRWRDTGVINAQEIERMIARHRSGAGDYGQELWTVIMYDAFLAVDPKRGAPF